MKIIDNYMTEEFHSNIFEEISSEYFLWHFIPTTVDDYEIDSENIIDNGQFVHPLYSEKDGVYDNDAYRLVFPLLNKIQQENNLIAERIKINLLPVIYSYPENAHHIPHTDSQLDDGNIRTTFIYYLNTTDGDTFLFDENGSVEERITPVANRILQFNSYMKHASSSPTKEPRFIINFVFRSMT